MAATKKQTNRKGTGRSSSGRKNTKKKTTAKQSVTSGFQTEIILLIILAASIILIFSNLGMGGTVGATISAAFFGVMGILAYLFPLLIFGCAVFLVSNRRNPLAYKKALAVLVFGIFLCGLIQLLTEGYMPSMTLADYYSVSSVYHTGGGVIGGAICISTTSAFGVAGGYVIIVLVLLISLILVTQKSFFGAVVKTAFCGPCFGAGDTPANNAFSIRHTTRNFPNREGSKVQNGQISSVALMDARSIAATAANKGFLTSAEEFNGNYTHQKYFFDKTIYENRIFDSKGVADPSVEIQFGPNIKDWPKMPALADNLVLKVVSEIHDPVTTTDELIPSGETSSFRSNPLGLAEFTLSRKDPAYVGRAKEIQKAQKALEAGECPAEAVPELKPVMETIKKQFAGISNENIGIGSTIFAVKPGDGSAREQAASCQKVLGGWANIANEYATKRYRSNLINWGMLPFLIPQGDLPFENGDYLFFPEVRGAVADKADSITGYVVKEDGLKEFQVTLGELTDDEREIILKGCLINYNRG